MNTQETKNEVKTTKGKAFWLKENQHLRLLSKPDERSERKAKEVLEKIQNIEIDLQGKFRHWGITVDKASTVIENKDKISIVFFKEEMMTSSITPGTDHYCKRLFEFDEKTLTKTIKKLVEKFDTETNSF